MSTTLKTFWSVYDALYFIDEFIIEHMRVDDLRTIKAEIRQVHEKFQVKLTIEEAQLELDI